MTPLQAGPAVRRNLPHPRQILRQPGFWRRLVRSLLHRYAERRLLPILGGPVYFQVVRTGFEIGLFDLLRRKPGQTVEEIARELGVPEESARVLLLNCVALGLLKKRKDKYRCRLLASRAFHDDAFQNVKAYFDWMHQIVHPSIFFLDEAVRERRACGLQAIPGSGDTLYDRLDGNPPLNEVFYHAMNARTRRHNANFLNGVDFSEFHRLLDVGGGDGEILVQIAKRYPQIEATLLDIDSVAEQARLRFSRENLADRLTAEGRDILHDEFPGGYDCLLVSHVLGNHSPEVNRRLLQRAAAALTSGGVICIYSAFANDAQTGPLSSALFSAYFLCTVTGEGRQYSWSEVESWLREAGFDEVMRCRLLHNHGVVLGRCP